MSANIMIMNVDKVVDEFTVVVVVVSSAAVGDVVMVDELVLADCVLMVDKPVDGVVLACKLVDGVLVDKPVDGVLVDKPVDGVVLVDKLVDDVVLVDEFDCVTLGISLVKKEQHIFSVWYR